MEEEEQLRPPLNEHKPGKGDRSVGRGIKDVNHTTGTVTLAMEERI
jgi:hypothetical protein